MKISIFAFGFAMGMLFLLFSCKIVPLKEIPSAVLNGIMVFVAAIAGAYGSYQFHKQSMVDKHKFDNDNEKDKFKRLLLQQVVRIKSSMEKLKNKSHSSEKDVYIITKDTGFWLNAEYNKWIDNLIYYVSEEDLKDLRSFLWQYEHLYKSTREGAAQIIKNANWEDGYSQELFDSMKYNESTFLGTYRLIQNAEQILNKI